MPFFGVFSTRAAATRRLNCLRPHLAHKPSFRTMLDINLLREDRGGNPELVRESQRKRGGKVELVDQVIELDNDWKKARFNADAINKKLNAINKEIGQLMKQKKKEEADAFLAQKTQLQAEKAELDEIAKQKEIVLFKTLGLIGNLVHDSVIVSNDEKNNAIVRSWWPEGRDEATERERRATLVGKDGKGVPGLLSHHEVLEKIEGYDSPRGSNVAGHRGYFLTGPGVDFNLALIQYGLDFLAERGYTKLWTPFFMKKEIMAKTAQLEEFDEALYKVVGELNPDGTEADGAKYLIATSEQPISALHMGEWFAEPEKDLPKKYAGVSTCFRKEAGAHGRDTWGIFRVHQFEKVEQFVLTDPEKSWEMHEEMCTAAEEFYKSLGLPYRTVSIVSGALNNAAAKKYDVEAWFPFQADYKELVSCSNCTDYQSRNLEIRVGPKKLNDTVKKYAHALNCTLTATERTICGILENYQTEDGVVVPPPLRNYMGGKSFIPFTKGVKGARAASAKPTPAADASKPAKPAAAPKSADASEGESKSTH
ncbi:uncharacterized protein BJ171DRAFT_510944 [Polychytrium aggregatum]|uniref:uncharacterized protein n=1 Tax=Polychytrium aggregatum TaxID=110093 RepID=UPI0022FF446A|nr:uncharacterized protein BJ171DRAFT_510944 [Polychytrium aggregatum]KAI9203127.1 hypothetical protein BJ171DRAFT_510944 [Polychytrium aggregatum]